MVRARIGKGLFVILGAAAWVWLSATTAACQAEAPPSSSSADPIALNTNGLGAQQAGRMDEAFSDYQQSAAAGNPTGEQLLGWCYWNGWGVEKDYATAVEWFKKSAAQNESGGQYGYRLRLRLRHGRNPGLYRGGEVVSKIGGHGQRLRRIWVG